MYATVEMDGGKASCIVQLGCSDVTRLDQEAGVAWLTEGDVLAESYFDGEAAVDPTTLRPVERRRVLEIAEASIWPAWEGY